MSGRFYEVNINLPAVGKPTFPAGKINCWLLQSVRVR
jgi:hypothetical protein